MDGPALTHNINAHLKVKCSATSRLVAGGTGDNTEVVGQAIDTLGYGSAAIVIAAMVASQTADKILTNEYVKIQECATEGGSYDAAEAINSTLTTICSGTGAQKGQQQVALNLAGRKRWVKVIYKPDSTALNTDVAEVAALLVLGGASVLPAA